MAVTVQNPQTLQDCHQNRNVATFCFDGIAHYVSLLSLVASANDDLTMLCNTVRHSEAVAAEAFDSDWDLWPFDFGCVEVVLTPCACWWMVSAVADSQ